MKKNGDKKNGQVDVGGTVARLKRKRELHLRLRERMLALGFDTDDPSSVPLAYIEAMTVIRTAELLNQEDMKAKDRIALLKTVHQIHPLGQLAKEKSKAEREADFQERFKKATPIDVEKTVSDE